MSLFMLVTCGYAMEITEFFKYDGIERPTTSQEKRAEMAGKFQKIHSEVNETLKTSLVKKRPWFSCSLYSY